MSCVNNYTISFINVNIFLVFTQFIKLILSNYITILKIRQLFKNQSSYLQSCGSPNEHYTNLRVMTQNKKRLNLHYCILRCFLLYIFYFTKNWLANLSIVIPP